MILMCKDRPVFDIENENVLCHNLLPGAMSKNASKESFVYWMEKRYSEKSNTFSRKLRGLVFGQGNRQFINEKTHALSLSDCYWVKDKIDETPFEDISPYKSDFWNGEGYYNGKSIPTLYVNGYLSKYWLDRRTLIKAKEKHEVYCSEIGKTLGIDIVSISEHVDGIAVTNFTNTKIMYEAADSSGKLDPEDFTTDDILEHFGVKGFDMLFFDALVGNGDRHAGNFGFMRDSDSGEYLGMAPLFDFDHAFESNNTEDVLIKEVIKIKERYKNRFDELCEKLHGIEILQYVAKRLMALEK